MQERIGGVHASLVPHRPREVESTRCIRRNLVLRSRGQSKGPPTRRPAREFIERDGLDCCLQGTVGYEMLFSGTRDQCMYGAAGWVDCS